MMVVASSVLAACGGGGGSTTELGAASTATPPPSRPASIPVPLDAPVVTAEDAVLRPVPDARPGPFSMRTCGPAATGPSRVTCKVAERGPMRLTARTSATRDGASELLVSRVEGATATPVLSYASGADAAERITLRVGEVDGRPGEEIVIGVRSPGSGSILEIDIIGGRGEVLAHRDLEQGRARLVPGGLEDAVARYAPDDPNCCPSGFTVSVITFDGSRWRVASTRAVEPSELPVSQFA